MNIREYDKRDASVVMELHEQALRGTGAYAPGPWDEDLKKIEETYLDPGGMFLVVEIEGKLVAMGAMKRVSDTTGEVKRMRVLPEFQQKGIGQAILDRLIKFAMEHGITRVVLDTTEVQVQAQRFYEKNGFARYGSDTWNGFEVLLYERWL